MLDQVLVSIINIVGLSVILLTIFIFVSRLAYITAPNTFKRLGFEGSLLVGIRHITVSVKVLLLRTTVMSLMFLGLGFLWYSSPMKISIIVALVTFAITGTIKSFKEYLYWYSTIMYYAYYYAMSISFLAGLIYSCTITHK